LTSFSRDSIIQRDSEEFLAYSKVAKEKGYLSSAVSDADLKEQYVRFSTRIRNECRIDPDRFENAQYKAFLNDRSVLNESKDVAHLLAGAMTRTSSEAVVEGMGSVAKNMQIRGE
jgi:hypothetical protein